MSEEQLKAFLKKVKGDTSLQKKLKAAAIHLMLLLIVDRIHAAKALQLTAEDNIKMQSATVELSEISSWERSREEPEVLGRDRDLRRTDHQDRLRFRFTDPKTGKTYTLFYCNPNWARELNVDIVYYLDEECETYDEMMRKFKGKVVR